ncbi:hypothetical protein [Desulfovibrio aminophilus]|uniref:hypothetical protein n=1 Tax=Desulfovibrio aminophilus TaxID=81425 RepID=UPI00339450CF
MRDLSTSSTLAALSGREVEVHLLRRGSLKGIVFEPRYQGEFDEADQPPER